MKMFRLPNGVFVGLPDFVEKVWIFNRVLSYEEAKHMYENIDEFDPLSREDFVAEITPEYCIHKLGNKIIIEGKTGFE